MEIVLDKDVIEHILSYVDINVLIHFRLTCKRFRGLTDVILHRKCFMSTGLQELGAITPQFYKWWLAIFSGNMQSKIFEDRCSSQIENIRCFLKCIYPHTRGSCKYVRNPEVTTFPGAMVLCQNMGYGYEMMVRWYQYYPKFSHKKVYDLAELFMFICDEGLMDSVKGLIPLMKNEYPESFCEFIWRFSRRQYSENMFSHNKLPKIFESVMIPREPEYIANSYWLWEGKLRHLAREIDINFDWAVGRGYYDF